ncbi:MAG: hypothetical protein HRU70_09270 [Phycisphaeraceae bacterium]|nr:MAG: hypothetical protein HRU70_09270 [Phycisphaeraceae bacterium]
MAGSIRTAWMIGAAGLAAGASGQDLRWTRTEGPRVGVAIVDLDVAGDRTAVAISHRRIFERDGVGAWSEITDGVVPTGHRLRRVVIRDGAPFLITDRGAVMRRIGASWIGVGLPVEGDTNVALADGGGSLWLVHNPFLPLANNVFRSDDDGESWTPIVLPADEFVGEVRVIDGVVFALRALGGGFLRSDDGGVSWEPSGDDGPELVIGGPVVVNGEWIAPGSPDSFVSSDRGRTWRRRASSGPVGALPTTDGDTIVTVVTGGVSVSADGGRTWRQHSSGLPGCLEGMIQDLGHEGRGFLAATPVGVYRSADGGRTWSVDAGSPTQGAATVMASGASLHAASISHARVFRLGQDQWETRTAGVPGCAQPLALHAEGPTVYMGSVYDGIVRSVDGGRTFAPLHAGIPIYNGTGGNQLREIGAITGHEGRVLAGTWFGLEFFNQGFQHSGGGMLRLNDAGTGWQRINRGFPIMARNLFNEPVYDPVISVSDAGGPWGRLVLVGTFRNGPARSADRGENWSLSNAGLPRDPNGFPPMINDFAVIGGSILAGAIGFPFFADPNGIDRGVFISRDGGLRWSPAEVNTARFAPANALAVFGGVAYAGADGVYRSTDEGRTWALVPGGPRGEVLDLAVHGDGLYAIVSDGVENVVWVGRPGCSADFNGDGFVDFFDLESFTACFEGDACPPGATADLNADGAVDFLDYSAFVEAYEAGC